MTSTYDPDRPRPHTDRHTLTALTRAITLLAVLRNCPPHPDPNIGLDPGHALHLAWSLSLQIDEHLSELIRRATLDGYTDRQLRNLTTHPRHDR